MKKTILTLAAASAFTMNAQAEQYWADNSVSVLYSESMLNPFSGQEIAQTTLTLEHVSGHSWGGLFYFVDRLSGEGESETYLEFSPSFTLTKMDGMVSNINAAYTLESGASTGAQLDNHLVGVGAGLNIPGMDFASVTLYRAFNDRATFSDRDDNQVTLTYGYSNGNLIIDGFLDYSFGNEDDSIENEMNFTPQITYNLAPALGLKNKFKVGVEYTYWMNKFGVDGEDQNSVSLLLKAHL